MHPDARLWRRSGPHPGRRRHGRRHHAARKPPAQPSEGSFTSLCSLKIRAIRSFHHDTTAAEIWEQMEGRVDGFVAGVGTGGTFSGIAQFLKEKNPAVVTVAVETEGSILQGGPPGKHKVEGIGVHLHAQNLSSRSL